MKNIDWNRLKAFYYTTKLGSFTQASKKMNRDQSSVTRQIQNLEKQLGVKIFDRKYQLLPAKAGSLGSAFKADSKRKR